MVTTRFLWEYAADNSWLRQMQPALQQQCTPSSRTLYGPVVSQTRGTVSSCFKYDGLDSTRHLTNSAGAMTDSYLYDAFGTTVSTSGASVNSFRWAGEFGYYRDAEVDRYYVRHRTYIPALATWASRDPISEAFPAFMLLPNPNQMQHFKALSTSVLCRIWLSTLRPYCYMGNHVNTNTDPSGLLPALQELLDALINPLLDKLKDITEEAALQDCQRWVNREKRNMQWLKDLPACPCYQCELNYGENKGKWTQPEVADQRFHPGADYCIRSLPVVLPPLASGQQCCYRGYELITSGPGAGTPDYIGPGPANVNVAAHFPADVQMFFTCRAAGQAGIDLYLSVRPPNNRMIANL